MLDQTDGEDSNRYGRANTNFPVLETYAEGSILEVKIVVSATHMVRSYVWRFIGYENIMYTGRFRNNVFVYVPLNMNVDIWLWG